MGWYTAWRAPQLGNEGDDLIKRNGENFGVRGAGMVRRRGCRCCGSLYSVHRCREGAASTCLPRREHKRSAACLTDRRVPYRGDLRVLPGVCEKDDRDRVRHQPIDRTMSKKM